MSDFQLVAGGFLIGGMIAVLSIELTKSEANLEFRPETIMYVNPINKDSVLIWASDSTEVWE